MEMKKLDELRKLKRASESLRSFHGRYVNIISDAKCDKHNFGFNISDDKFVNFSAGQVTFNSWRGYYGSSSCSIVELYLPDDLAKKYFRRAINYKAKEIFQLMAELIELDAVELKVQAEKEIEEANNLLDSIMINASS